MTPDVFAKIIHQFQMTLVDKAAAMEAEHTDA